MLGFLIKWTVLILIVLTIAKTEWGRALVVYSLWLIVLLLVVVNGKEIAVWLNPKNVNPNK